jgi:hypothetical protein
MVTVYHHRKVNVFAKGRRHNGRNHFFHVAIELCPFKGWEGSLVSLRVCWVKDESSDMLQSEISHDMQGVLKVALTWACQVRR